MQVMSLTSSIYDHFYHLTVKCDLDRQPTNLHFFTKNPNLKKMFVFLFFFSAGWGVEGGVGRGWAGSGGGAGVDGWTEEQAQTNLPIQLFRSWGHNNELMYKLCP